jgi:hypothetical protein
MATDNIQGTVARLKTYYGFQPDGQSSNPNGSRVGPRGELYNLSPVPSKALLAQEGSYFTANNSQTGIATAAAPTSFSATNPFILLENNSGLGSGVVIVPDYALLVATAAGTSGTQLLCAITKDTILRYTSGGTALPPQKMNSLGPASVANLWAGNITAASAGSVVQTPVGERCLLGTIPVVYDTYVLAFGSVDGTFVQGKQTINAVVQPVPPMVINPQESLLIHLWLPAQAAASSYAPEIGWWEW